MNEASAPSCKNATYPEDGLQLLDLAYVAPWSQTDQPHLRGISRPLVWNLELRRGGSGGSGVGNPSKLTNRVGTERRGPNPHSDLSRFGGSSGSPSARTISLKTVSWPSTTTLGDAERVGYESTLIPYPAALRYASGYCFRKRSDLIQILIDVRERDSLFMVSFEGDLGSLSY
jgi:hypothetical protein